MHQVVIELSYADYVLVAVDAGFLVEVIRLGLWGIYASKICCRQQYVWIVAICMDCSNMLFCSPAYPIAY